MFNSISWQEYISATAILAVFYYVISFLILYRKEISSIFNQSSPKNTNEDVSDAQTDSNASNSLMGSIKYESHEQETFSREKISASEEISFAPQKQEDEPIDATLNNTIYRLASALLTEIESLLEVISKDDKKETVTFFQALLHNYPQLIGTDFQEEINQHIIDSLKQTCEFQVELNEVKSWWPTLSQASNDHQ